MKKPKIEGVVAKVAPAVAMLLASDAVLAGTAPTDGVIFPDGPSVPEPATLGLLAIGAAAGGAAAYIRNKRRKK